MANDWLNIIIDSYHEHTKEEHLVLIIMANERVSPEGIIQITVKAIAKKARMSEDSIWRVLNTLEEKGHIETLKTIPGNGSKGNIYRVISCYELMPNPAPPRGLKQPNPAPNPAGNPAPPRGISHIPYPINNPLNQEELINSSSSHGNEDEDEKNKRDFVKMILGKELDFDSQKYSLRELACLWVEAQKKATKSKKGLFIKMLEKCQLPETIYFDSTLKQYIQPEILGHFPGLINQEPPEDEYPEDEEDLDEEDQTEQTPVYAPSQPKTEQEKIQEHIDYWANNHPDWESLQNAKCEFFSNMVYIRVENLPSDYNRENLQNALKRNFASKDFLILNHD